MGQKYVIKTASGKYVARFPDEYTDDIDKAVVYPSMDRAISEIDINGDGEYVVPVNLKVWESV